MTIVEKAKAAQEKTAVTSHIRGHKIYCKDDRWFYSDDDSPAVDGRSCKKCSCFPQKIQIKGGGSLLVDACQGLIPKVVDACCGHGVERGYTVDIDCVIRHKLEGRHSLYCEEILLAYVIPRYKHKTCPRCGGKRNLGRNWYEEVTPCTLCVNLLQAKIAWNAYCDRHEELAGNKVRV